MTKRIDAQEMTYSIVAHDPVSGEVGVAVATGGPGVGSMVPWVEPGVGAVATQSFTNVDLGPAGLELLRAGAGADVVVARLVEADARRDVRQIGVVDAAGGSEAYTGRACVAEAGHSAAPHVSTQANMVERTSVWDAMQRAFAEAGGDLADRLLASLDAAEHEGGDIRGIRSAALLVAPGSPRSKPWLRRFDLRVDTSIRPLDDLGQLLRIGRGREAIEAAIEANKAGELELALDRTTAAYALAPEDATIVFWHAMALASNGQTDDAGAVLESALRIEPRLADYAQRYVDAGHGAAMTEALRAVRTRPGRWAALSSAPLGQAAALDRDASPIHETD